MNREVLTLRFPVATDEASFRAAVREFRSVDTQWGFAFEFDEQMDFAGYARQVNGWSRGEGLPEGFVPNTFLVAVVGADIVGRVSIRHVLTDFLRRYGGHIGYGVIPSQRRKGYGGQILKQALPIARDLGIERALLTCDDDNEASARIIEANGGVFEDLLHAPELRGPKRRYWIQLR